MRACAATVSQLQLGAAPVGDEPTQKCTKDDMAPKCLPEAPLDRIMPHSAAALPGSECTVWQFHGVSCSAYDPGTAWGSCHDHPHSLEWGLAAIPARGRGVDGLP